ncbi:MAG TPA: caspase family protein [Geobacteraceae bacterium]
MEILAPAPDASVAGDSVRLTVKIKDNGGGIGSVAIYLNGAQVANESRGVTVKGEAAADERLFTFRVPLVAGDNEIRVTAVNRDSSMESTPAQIKVTSRAVVRKPNLYALVVGINTYRNKSISLAYAVSDATAVAATLKKSAGQLFDKTDIRLLTTPAATSKEAIVRAFDELRSRVGPNDLFVFYDASHGIVDVVDNEEQYYLITSNVLFLSSRHVGKEGLSQKELARLIGSIPAQKKLVILDTCNAGKGGTGIQAELLRQTRGLTESTAVKLLQRSIGSAVFSASSDTQQALEGYNGHGLFTYVLLEGLKGKADVRKDGYVTVLGLADYVEEEVVKLSEEIFRRQQIPTIQTGANFPIAKVR